MQSKYAQVSGIVFGVVAALQITRIIARWPVQIGPIDVPLWFSFIAVIVTGYLCIWAFKSVHR